MKKVLLITAAILNLAIVALFLTGKVVLHSSSVKAIDSAEIEELRAIKEREEKSAILGQYAINMMYETSAAKKLSEARKQVLARAIVRVSNDVFDSFDHKKGFVAVLAIESEFQKYAQSPTGPKGLSQVAKAAFKEGMAACGVTDLNDDDVWETDINLYAGACYFRGLLEAHNNDPFVAIVAYNQGPNSKDAKSYSKFGTADEREALKYIARFTFLKRKVTEEKSPNAPDLKDLPVPGKNVRVDAGPVIKGEPK